MNSILKGVERESQAQEDRPSGSEVEETLRLILESHPFRPSKQCQCLLRYIVDHSLSGDDGLLKERVIGMEVFLRKPAYDTNQDPVVRVRAADVRKRLAQYYQSLEPGTSALHIELQPGSYRAHFRYERVDHGEPGPAPTAVVEAEQPAAISPGPAQKTYPWFFRRRSKIWAAVLSVLLIAGGARWVQLAWPTPQERFWAPMTTAKQPVLIYLGANAAYVLSSGFLAKYRAEHGMPNNGPEFFVDLPPNSSLSAADLFPVKDTFVTTADVAAVVQLTTLLRDWKRPFVLRSGSDLSFGDLLNRPSVMVGAFNNSWTIELTNDLPYSFRRGVEIYNRDHPDKSWSVGVDSRNSSTVDYALITPAAVFKDGRPLCHGRGDWRVRNAGCRRAARQPGKNERPVEGRTSRLGKQEYAGSVASQGGGLSTRRGRRNRYYILVENGTMAICTLPTVVE